MTNEELFKGIASGLTRRTYFKIWPDLIFFFKGDKCMFSYDFNSGILLCNYEIVWSVFEDKNNWDFHEVQSFIKNQVEQHFRNKEVTPLSYEGANG